MRHLLWSEKRWAKFEFEGAQLGDLRRTKRLVKTAKFLAKSPRGTLPGSFPGNASLKAAYRLFAEEEMAYEKVIQAHVDRVRDECKGAGEYLIIEDTTLLDFTWHKGAKGLGRIGDDRGLGFLLHSSIAARVERWKDGTEPEVTLVGLFDQVCWVREGAAKRKRETKRQRLSRKRESQRWTRAFEKSGRAPEGVDWIYVADRESDIYEVFLQCTRYNVDFVVRASQKRALEGDDRKIFGAVSEAAVLGRYQKKLRRRGSVPARTAQIEVRSMKVTLRAPWRPDVKHPPFTLSVVEAREIAAEGVKNPVHWILLSSLPVENFEDAKKVIGIYTKRWLIEEYHKALKTGTRIEASQLQEASRIKALLGVLAIVALRLLAMKFMALARPDDKINPDDMDEVFIKILEKTYGKPKGGWTYRTYLVWVARLGGFQARRGDGMPGWLTIWRGWQRVIMMYQGYLLATDGGL